jgi:hypothetical protein
VVRLKAQKLVNKVVGQLEAPPVRTPGISAVFKLNDLLRFHPFPSVNPLRGIERLHIPSVLVNIQSDEITGNLENVLTDLANVE